MKYKGIKVKLNKVIVIINIFNLKFINIELFQLFSE